MKAATFEHLKMANTSLESLPNTKILKSLGCEKGFMDHFYLTGYEGLCLALNHKDLTRSIISSAVPFEGELLVIGNTDSCALWRQVCAELRIRVSAIDIAECDLLTAAETILKVNTRISHILCTTEAHNDTIKQLSLLAHKNRKAIIVDNSADDMNMADVENCEVDFVISASDECNMSVIVARRSKLVMTEGNARNFQDDIYAMWQESLASRSAVWAPMA